MTDPKTAPPRGLAPHQTRAVAEFTSHPSVSGYDPNEPVIRHELTAVEERVERRVAALDRDVKETATRLSTQHGGRFEQLNDSLRRASEDIGATMQAISARLDMVSGQVKALGTSVAPPAAPAPAPSFWKRYRTQLIFGGLALGPAIARVVEFAFTNH